MKCKDCKVRKCLHSFNANNVDRCERIKEVRGTILHNDLWNYVLDKTKGLKNE